MRALGPTWLHRPPRRLGLRARVTTAFTLSALVLSVILATITYTATRSAILRSEAAAARRQTYVNASFLRRALPNSHQPSQLLSTLGTNASTSILSYQGAWHAYPLLVQRTLPGSLRRQVLGGDAAEQYFVLPDGHPALGVGVPIAADQASYFEIFDLQTVGHTLGILALAVAAAAAATTLLGAAAGGELSRRALAPLAKTARVAEEIAGGRLETRLVADEDVDLHPLAESFNTMVDALEQRIRRDA
ncbi:MAG TPA: HAMP domain-containing protein, partial [Acidimicrobiales bacterium]|nr:HAMP domain-containing protein [Acidimicrobiales bacterium]